MASDPGCVLSNSQMHLLHEELDQLINSLADRFGVSLLEVEDTLVYALDGIPLGRFTFDESIPRTLRSAELVRARFVFASQRPAP